MGCRVSYVPLGELAEFESGGTPSKKTKATGTALYLGLALRRLWEMRFMKAT